MPSATDITLPDTDSEAVKEITETEDGYRITFYNATIPNDFLAKIAHIAEEISIDDTALVISTDTPNLEMSFSFDEWITFCVFYHDLQHQTGSDLLDEAEAIVAYEYTEDNQTDTADLPAFDHMDEVTTKPEGLELIDRLDQILELIWTNAPDEICFSEEKAIEYQKQLESGDPVSPPAEWQQI